MGRKLTFNGRHQTGCRDEFASYAHGTKGSAIISTASPHPGKVRTFKGHKLRVKKCFGPFPSRNRAHTIWNAGPLGGNRENKPYNEVKRGVEASLVTAMGRFAAHTGQEVTFDEMLNHDHEFAPNVDKLTMDVPRPCKPAPMAITRSHAGVKKNREY